MQVTCIIYKLRVEIFITHKMLRGDFFKVTLPEKIENAFFSYLVLVFLSLVTVDIRHFKMNQNPVC